MTLLSDPAPETGAVPVVDLTAGVPLGPERRIPSLSVREVEVLSAYLRLPNADAAARSLYVAPSTFSTHLSRIRDKYDVVGRPARSKTWLLIRALEDGALSLADFVEP